jgi:hypothetical protein
VVLLGEATAPVLGELEDLEAAAGSSQGEHAGRRAQRLRLGSRACRSEVGSGSVRWCQWSRGLC